MKQSAVVIWTLLLCAGQSDVCAQPVTAFVNARVVTVDPRRPLAETVLIRGDRILAVGRTAELQSRIPAGATIIDCEGRLILPGLIDGHAHLAGLGHMLATLNLVGVDSEEAIARRVARQVATAQPGEWIIGRGWDQNRWAGKNFPTFKSISEVAPENPVCLTRIDGHAVWTNTRAMDIAGVDDTAQAPDGGQIIRQPGTRQPSGVFIDRAKALIERHIPPIDAEQRRRELRRAAQACVQAGLTTVHNAGMSPDMVDDVRRLIDAGDFPLRLYGMIRVPEGLHSVDIDHFLRKHHLVNYGNQRLTVRAIKQFSDGALGSRGAALLDPYTDDPDSRGLLITGSRRIEEVALAALRTGFQVNTHCIGDRAVRETLDGYERALRQLPAEDHRFRIEHASVIAEEDFPRFALLGVLPSIQHLFVTSDMLWIKDRLGARRLRGVYATRRFRDLGVPVIGGSDFPVETHRILETFYAAVTRQDAQQRPEGGWQPDQLLTRMEVLRSITIDAAFGAFEEDLKGSLTPGKLADLVIINRNIMTIPAPDILNAAILLTMVGGDIVYQSPDW